MANLILNGSSAPLPLACMPLALRVALYYSSLRTISPMSPWSGLPACPYSYLVCLSPCVAIAMSACPYIPDFLRLPISVNSSSTHSPHCLHSGHPIANHVKR
ncbi:MAG: hypothetical protein F6J90_12710 [Moorea sp. SIOASIH]|uniref:hypothetical protein n=1 Tax=Moorena sp. SIOASIH TaxID=2607817 RepID=UPI0013BB7F3D|nr:hypothetical protein [Moorena sp. SIOASIH]NEO37128.1 hypothetical protein [Moorena sp. SIOASIH]